MAQENPQRENLSKRALLFISHRKIKYTFRIENYTYLIQQISRFSCHLSTLNFVPNLCCTKTVLTVVGFCAKIEIHIVQIILLEVCALYRLYDTIRNSILFLKKCVDCSSLENCVETLLYDTLISVLYGLSIPYCTDNTLSYPSPRFACRRFLLEFVQTPNS